MFVDISVISIYRFPPSRFPPLRRELLSSVHEGSWASPPPFPLFSTSILPCLLKDFLNVRPTFLVGADPGRRPGIALTATPGTRWGGRGRGTGAGDGGVGVVLGSRCMSRLVSSRLVSYRMVSCV